jgi:hypothetical protein
MTNERNTREKQMRVHLWEKNIILWVMLTSAPETLVKEAKIVSFVLKVSLFIF